MKDMRDFKIAAGEPDIRGWEVRTLSGSEVGEVDDLLIDSHRGEVVMITIDVKGTDQHVNVPIRGVQLDRSRNCVIVDSGDIRNAQNSIGYGDEGLTDAAPISDDVNAPRTVADARAVDARPVDLRDNDTEEVVIERRPIVEEVVVRRRVVDTDGINDVDDEVR
jgi:sporulation protein YlmC with PRC-barrel domain